MRKIVDSFLGVVVVGLVGIVSVHAQPFPSKPVLLHVPATSGTTTDLIGRLVAQGLSKDFGRPVVVENRGGGAGNLAHELVAAAPADGHTLIFTNIGPMAINVSLYKKLNFDPLKDFTLLAMVSSSPTALVVRADGPWKTIDDLVQGAKQNPGKLTYASPGVATTGHLAGALFTSMSGANITHVPYKAGTQALLGVISGETDFMFYHPALALPHVKAGKLRALGLSGKSRSILALEVQPLAEQGYSDFDLIAWWGLAAPVSLPPKVTERLLTAIENLLNSKEFQDKLLGLGVEPFIMKPSEFERFVVSETEKWRKIVKLSGAQVD